MSWKKVKEDVLIACKRHCCYCERYKGIDIEVHHIIQRADGGEDSFDNAIALCFDCHSQIGSYNPKHPKGNKFSAGELKRIRNDFYQKVKNIPRYEEHTDYDKELLRKLKNDFTDYMEYCIKTDFAAEPVKLLLADELYSLIDKWTKKKYTFEDNIIENLKIEILQSLSNLCEQLSPEYFHCIDDNRIIFNLSSVEDGIRLEKMRKTTYQIRVNLKQLLDTMYSL